MQGVRGSAFIDTLVGSDNKFTGQAGANTFVHVTGGGADIIDRFSQPQGDKIDLTGVGSVHSFADLAIIQQGANAVINFGNGDSLTLAGITATDLGDSDFIFNPAGSFPWNGKTRSSPLRRWREFRLLDRSQQRWPHFHRIFGDWLYLRSNNATAHGRYHHLDAPG